MRSTNKVLLHILILHQTTTITTSKNMLPSCFIFWFYIKPQPCAPSAWVRWGCFIFWFYIKPQPVRTEQCLRSVASYFDSTSNHNFLSHSYRTSYVASYFDSTSNHNTSMRCCIRPEVASYFDSTSNHNVSTYSVSLNGLLHILILHQTTTFWFVIINFKLLLHILILHQTTTCTFEMGALSCCFIFWFYIKPQPVLFKILNISILYKYFHTRSGLNISELLQIY